MTNKPYVNLGCGRIILPAARPDHHNLVEELIYAYPHWVNVDRHNNDGVQLVADLFEYPWPLPDNAFDGALLAHIVEHIPHEIKLRPMVALSSRMDLKQRQTAEWINARRFDLGKVQDGWYAFFAELWRVLADGAVAHILAPHGRSDGGMADPTHTRYLTSGTFWHSIVPDKNAPFFYENGGIHFEHDAPVVAAINPLFAAYQAPERSQELKVLMETQFNVVTDLYARLRVVKA